MEFLETIEQIQASEASVHRLFGSDGRGVRSRAANPQYKRKLASAATMIAEVRKGQRPFSHLSEAMTTSDFPLLMADVIDRSILGNYREAPKRWPRYLGRRVVRDFRTTKLFTIDGGTGYLSEIVPEMTEYPAAALSEGKYELSVKKFGRRFPYSWELALMEDMDFLEEIPRRFGVAAARTEDRLAVDLFVGATGPDSTFFSSGNANIVTSNPVLSIEALATALTQMFSQTDEDGEPIVVDGPIYLVVPPALALEANRIIGTVEYRIGTGTNTRIIRGNGLGATIEVIVEPYIPAIATSNQNTSWFLFYNSGRPAATMAFLRGYEEPQVFVRESNQRRVGAGGSNPMDGSFENDSIDHKVRHVVGAVLLDPRSAMASNGSGS